MPAAAPILALLGAALLAGCGGGEFADLDRYMAEQRARPGGAIAPAPDFTAYETFSYGAATLRSPFDRPAGGAAEGGSRPVAAPRPDERRPKEFLEGFTLNSLALVGALSRAGAEWGLIRDPLGGVHRVRPGNYLGRNYGRITEVTESRVKLVEIVPDAGRGWVERPRSIELRRSE